MFVPMCWKYSVGCLAKNDQIEVGRRFEGWVELMIGAEKGVVGVGYHWK